MPSLAWTHTRSSAAMRGPICPRLTAVRDIAGPGVLGARRYQLVWCGGGAARAWTHRG